jgi:hypothetical protein
MIECWYLLLVDRTPDVTKEPAWAARKETPTHDDTRVANCRTGLGVGIS